jgi:hypothetical protein
VSVDVVEVNARVKFLDPMAATGSALFYGS